MRVEIEPGVRLYFDVEGMGFVPQGDGWRDKPTLVLLHGGPGMDHRHWKPRMSPLADLAQLVYYDHRSHGRSDSSPARDGSGDRTRDGARDPAHDPAHDRAHDWTLDRWADDIVLLCRALGIERPIVFGQSFGGMVAQRYLARHPSHPGKVILSSCSPHLGLDRKLAAFERLGGAHARDVARAYWSDPRPEAFETFLRVCLPLYNPTPQPERGGALPVFDNELIDTWNRVELPHLDLLPGLARAECPVLVMGGEEDPITPIDDQRDIAAALPQHLVRFERFAGAGHGIWRDRPDAAIALLREFIAM
jgi:pimeloyl-ACP methyl ester carboxylesterase